MARSSWQLPRKDNHVQWKFLAAGMRPRAQHEAGLLKALASFSACDSQWFPVLLAASPSAEPWPWTSSSFGWIVWRCATLGWLKGGSQQVIFEVWDAFWAVCHQLVQAAWAVAVGWPNCKSSESFKSFGGSLEFWMRGVWSRLWCCLDAANEGQQLSKQDHSKLVQELAHLTLGRPNQGQTYFPCRPHILSCHVTSPEIVK